MRVVSVNVGLSRTVRACTRAVGTPRDIERLVALGALPEDWPTYFEKKPAEKRQAAAREQERE